VSAPSPMTQSAVVLLVQPERDDRDMYAEFLRYSGLTPVVVSHASPELAVAERADVIVTAVRLPGEADGVELIKQLKQDARTKNTPIIVLTSSAWDSERARAISVGCDLFLAKPCLPEQLVDGIRRVLTLSRRREHVRDPPT